MQDKIYKINSRKRQNYQNSPYHANSTPKTSVIIFNNMNLYEEITQIMFSFT